MQRHILPALGRIGLRRLRHQHIEALYDQLLHPDRRAGPRAQDRLRDPPHHPRRARRRRPPRAGHPQRRRSSPAPRGSGRLQRTEGTVAGPTSELRQFLRTAAGHRLLPAALAHRDDRHAPQRGPRAASGPTSTSPSSGSHSTAGSSPSATRSTRPAARPQTARRTIDLDDTTLAVLAGWRALQAAEFAAVGIDNAERWVFTDGDGEPVHPHAVYAGVRAHRPQRRRPVDPLPRPAPHPRHPAHQGRRPGQGRQRTARPRQHRLHHRRPTSTSCPACRPTPPAPSNASPTRSTGRRRARWNAGGTPGGRPPEPGRTPRQRRRPRSLTWAFTHEIGGGGRI